MSAGARDLVQRVLPHVPIHQGVLSLRVRLAFDHDGALALWRIVQAQIDGRYRRIARKTGNARPRGGSLVVVHRSSSDLRLNVHYHALFLDGAYDDRSDFHAAPAPSREEIETILARVIARAEKLFETREPDLDQQDLTIAQAYAASTRSERHPPDEDPHDFGVQLTSRRKARIEEWDLDAEVFVREHDRERLEQLCRYLLRPPLALDRLRTLDDGRIGIAAIAALGRPHHARDDDDARVHRAPGIAGAETAQEYHRVLRRARRARVGTHGHRPLPRARATHAARRLVGRADEAQLRPGRAEVPAL